MVDWLHRACIVGHSLLASFRRKSRVVLPQTSLYLYFLTPFSTCISDRPPPIWLRRRPLSMLWRPVGTLFKLPRLSRPINLPRIAITPWWRKHNRPPYMALSARRQDEEVGRSIFVCQIGLAYNIIQLGGISMFKYYVLSIILVELILVLATGVGTTPLTGEQGRRTGKSKRPLACCEY